MSNSNVVQPALRALLSHVFDYAGLFPPAALSIANTVQNYNAYTHSKYGWMLGALVVNEQNLKTVPPELNKHLAALAEYDEPRAATIESKGVVSASKPVYCEVSVDELEKLAAVKEAGCFAKIRTGALKAEGIPSPKQVAAFILQCARLRLPFKATAGLHHPIRGEYALTYEPNSARATMHGFLNVIIASVFAAIGDQDIVGVLEETNAGAFQFGESVSWSGKQLSVEQITAARNNLFHSIGSCSFTEPIEELQALKLLD